METRPIIGWEAIHKKYFVAESGEELMSISTFKKMSKEMQEAGAVLRFEIMRQGRKYTRIVCLEPLFTIWMQKKFGSRSKSEICIPE